MSKRTTAFLIVLSALSLLSACGKENQSSTQSAPVQISTPTEQTSGVVESAVFEDISTTETLKNPQKTDENNNAKTDTASKAKGNGNTASDKNDNSPVNTSAANSATVKKAVSSATATSKKDDGSVSVNGCTLTAGMVMTDSIVSSLGTPDDIQNAPSCHFDGNDTIYVFESFSLYTYKNGNDNILYLIEINDSSISTPAGAKVGMSLDEIKSIYGNDYSQRGSSIKYNISGSVSENFTYAGDKITMIEIEAVTA